MWREEKRGGKTEDERRIVKRGECREMRSGGVGDIRRNREIEEVKENQGMRSRGN